MKLPEDTPLELDQSAPHFTIDFCPQTVSGEHDMWWINIGTGEIIGKHIRVDSMTPVTKLKCIACGLIDDTYEENKTTDN